MTVRHDQVAEFIAANDRSPVVQGYVRSAMSGGAVYTLRSGTAFALTRDECRALPPGYPRWHHG